MSEHRGEAADCTCPRTDGYRIKRRGCPAHAETDAAYWRDSDRRKFGTDSPHEPTDEFVRRAFAEGARALWPDSRDPGWIVTFNRWLDARVAEFQHNTLEMARKADLAERRAEEAEYHVEQLRDARDRAERRIERACEVLDGWEHDGPKGYQFHLLILRVREALDGAGRACRRCGCGVDGDGQCPCGCDEPNECDHEWLDRPESDTRECLICGTEVAG